ncbi:Gfo/Idh/MocA family oxidoreductase [Gramella sp. MAR_2010_147]|uniref:Gfo/Idh/MocA family protein n=1 Tax=Gramella sp. MAR_2010_147 TaxID=1250205 RepID=UPI00087B0E8F|nr:Gfo/Idh/MocA family oxidoreductase [Gramella sp. MAR_2010_147]SDS64441.1 Predicted dehydrogenase [Gramella sp. MAR_2010_147]
MKRREFVIKGGLTSMALTASTSLLGNVNSILGANDTINIGIIGTGRRGRGLIPIVKQIKNLNIVACCDVIPSHLDMALKQVDGRARGYSDYRKLLDDRDVDAVLVATPFSMHSNMNIDAMNAGKHVYGEKTLAKGYDGIQNLLKARNSKIIFQTGHQYHSSRLYSHIIELIQGGKIGQIAALECQWNRSGDWRRPVDDPEMERLINWRMYREYSGGLTAELSSHQIDFAMWLLESTPTQVMGTGGIDYWKDGRETYDNTHLIYSYPNGVEAKYTCLTTNARSDYQIKVMGDKGTIILDNTRAWFYPEVIPKDKEKEIGNVDGVSGATIQWEEGKGIPINVEHANPSKQALMDFRDSVINNKVPLSNLITGSQTAIAVQMALDAMYNNEIVKWKSEFDTWLSEARCP